MAVKLWSNRIEQFVDGTGVPRSGAKLFTYVGGSVNTKQTTYTESTGSTPNTNPVVLDSSGRIPQPIWLTTGVSYKFVLAPPTDTDPPTSPIDTLDVITGINDSSASQSEWISGPTPTFVSATQFTLAGDQTTNFAKSRRVKATVTAGTVFGDITASTFGALTTVTVALDSGNLDSGLSAIAYGIVAAANPSINADLVNRKGTAVASAATTDIWSIAGDYVHVTGATGPITSFGTAPYAGAQRTVIFDSTPAITHNATTLQLPGGVNIPAAAVGDRAIVRADTTANMIVLEYIKASGLPVIGTSVPRMHISGLTSANNGADSVDISAGEATDSTNVRLMQLGATITKNVTVAWAVGSAQGGLDTGTVGNNDYYAWLIARVDTGVVDVLFSLSSTAPTMPASYTLKRLIGWFKRVGATNVAFHTYETEGGGLELMWDSPTLDVSLLNTLTTTRRTDSVKVPQNFSVTSNLNVVINDVTTSNSVYIYCPDMTDLAPNQSAVTPLATMFMSSTVARAEANIFVRTSAAGLIAARSDLATVDAYAVATLGFRWARRN